MKDLNSFYKSINIFWNFSRVLFANSDEEKVKKHFSDLFKLLAARVSKAKNRSKTFNKQIKDNHLTGSMKYL